MDTVMCEISNFNINKMYHLLSASASGLGCSDISKIEITGEKLETVRIKNFKVPPNFLPYMVPKKFAKFMGNFISALPVMDKKKCTKCMTCIKACPMKAIELKNIPKVDKSKCILCLCCNELCPENAVKIRYSILIRIFLFLREIKRLIS